MSGQISEHMKLLFNKYCIIFEVSQVIEPILEFYDWGLKNPDEEIKQRQQQINFLLENYLKRVFLINKRIMQRIRETRLQWQESLEQSISKKIYNMTSGPDISAEDLLKVISYQKNSDQEDEEAKEIDSMSKKAKKRKNRGKKMVKDQDLSLLSDYAMTIKYTSDTQICDTNKSRKASNELYR